MGSDGAVSAWHALRRWGAEAWPLLQGTAAATAAWIIATHVVDHRQLFFAPIAAVVALNAHAWRARQERAAAVLGVIVGITAGELTVAALGGYGRLALATFVAMAVAHARGGARIVIAQAAASAILTVAVANGVAGTQRLVDALIGAGVALVFLGVDPLEVPSEMQAMSFSATNTRHARPRWPRTAVNWLTNWAVTRRSLAGRRRAGVRLRDLHGLRRAGDALRA
jgi:hypothetical protein